MPSGGQRSSPLSTAPSSLGSTTIEGSRWPSRGPFSQAPTMACKGSGQGVKATAFACLACPALSTGRMGVPNLSSLQGQVSSCTCVHIPQRVVALPLPPWSWGTQRLGHTEPTWAQPSGPFHRRACGGKGQGHTVSEPGLCASPAGSLPQQARLLPGVSLRALGLLPAWGSWEAVPMATGATSLGSLFSATRACGGCLPKPSWGPRHLRLPFKAFQGRGLEAPHATHRPAALTLLCQPTSSGWSGWSPSGSSHPNLLPRRPAACALCLPQRRVEVGKSRHTAGRTLLNGPHTSPPPSAEPSEHVFQCTV